MNQRDLHSAAASDLKCFLPSGNLVPHGTKSAASDEWTDARLGDEIRAVYKGVQAHRHNILYLGYLCLQLRDRYSYPGRRSAGPTFASALNELGVPRTTAHRAIVRYEESAGIRPTKARPKIDRETDDRTNCFVALCLWLGPMMLERCVLATLEILPECYQEQLINSWEHALPILTRFEEKLCPDFREYWKPYEQLEISSLTVGESR